MTLNLTLMLTMENENVNNVFWSIYVSRNKIIHVDKILHEKDTETTIMTMTPDYVLAYKFI